MTTYTYSSNLGNGGSDFEHAMAQAVNGHVIMTVGFQDTHVYSSTDGGLTWASINAQFGGVHEGGSRMIRLPNNDLILGTFHWDNTAPNIYRSVNSGLTWTLLKTLSVGGDPTFTGLHQCLALCRTGNSTLLAGTWSDEETTAPNKRIWRSTDNGATWTVVFSITTTSTLYKTGFYDIIDCGGGVILACGTAKVSGVAHALVWRSTDDGATWALAHDFSLVNPNPIANPSTDNYATSLFKTFSGIVLLGTDQGRIYYSLDNGVSWTWTAFLADVVANTTGVISQFHEITGYGIFVLGNSDNGSPIFYGSCNGLTWTSVLTVADTNFINIIGWPFFPIMVYVGNGNFAMCQDSFGDQTIAIQNLTPLSCPVPPCGNAMFFTVGQNPDYNPAGIWKYDGVNAPVHVADLNINCNGDGNDPVCMVTFAKNGKIYIVTQNYEEQGGSFGWTDCSNNPLPDGPFVNGANSIYELDPATNVLTHVLDYNYVDSYMGGDLVPACVMYDDGNFIYIAHQGWGSDDWHLVRFDPIAGTTTLVFGPYAAQSYYVLGGSLQFFTTDSQGFIARVGSKLYLANGSQIFSSTTGNVGTWSLVTGAGIFAGQANWVRYGPTLDIGLISKGTYDANGDYWFPATNDTTSGGGSLWTPYNLWNLSVFKIAAATGNITLEYQNLDDGSGGGGSTYGLFGYQSEQIINRNNVLTSINDGIDIFQHPIGTFLQSSGFILDNSAGWAAIGSIPYSIYLSHNHQSSSGPNAAVMFGTDLYIIAIFDDTIGSGGFGSHLIKQNMSGTWSIIQSWVGYQTIANSRGQMLNIVVANTCPSTPTPVTEIVVPYCPVRAWIVLSDTSGNELAIFDDWKDLQIKHKINSYSECALAIDGLDPRVDLFNLDYIIEVYREVGSYIYIEYTGLHRVFQPQLTQDQHSIFTSISRGLLDLINRRLVLYQSETPFTFKSAPGETVIKQIVNENAGPLGNTIIRYYNGQIQGLSIQPDSAQGKVWTNSTGNGNVLKLIQSISQLTSVDFDLILTGKLPVTFEFRCYFPQRGNDLSATFAFSPLLGNMVGPIYTHDYSQETNVVIVFGPGQDGSRLVSTFINPDIIASPWNKIESTVSASGLPNISGLSNQFIYEAMQAAGNTALTNNQPIQSFTFDVLQTDVTAYGRDYKLGDIVTANFGKISLPLKIVGVDLQIKEGVESIKLEFSNIPTQL